MPFALLLAHPGDLMTFVASLSPNRAIVIATTGICLIFLELNRPGRVIPGALGLTLLLLAAAALSHHQLQPAALVLLLLSSGTLTANLWRQLPSWLGGAAILAFALSLRFLIPECAYPHVLTSTALTCGLAIGLLGTARSRIALRARRLKAVH